MAMNIVRVLFGIILVSTIIVSCQKDIDIVPPTLDIDLLGQDMVNITVCGETIDNGILVDGGRILEFRVRAKDNDELSQLKLDIHNNFDCHGHGSALAPVFPSPDLNNNTEDFNQQTIFPLTGNDTAIVVRIEIPQNVTFGDYHIGFQLIDKSGNAAESIFLDGRFFNNEDKEAPRLSILNINAMPESIKRGEILKIIGEVQDNRELGLGGNGVVFLNYTNLSSGSNSSTNSYRVFDAQDGKFTTFNLEYSVPNFLVKGQYKFTIAAFDGVRNVSNIEEFILMLE